MVNLKLGLIFKVFFKVLEVSAFKVLGVSFFNVYKIFLMCIKIFDVHKNF